MRCNYLVVNFDFQEGVFKFLAERKLFVENDVLASCVRLVGRLEFLVAHLKPAKLRLRYESQDYKIALLIASCNDAMKKSWRLNACMRL